VPDGWDSAKPKTLGICEVYVVNKTKPIDAILHQAKINSSSGVAYLIRIGFYLLVSSSSPFSVQLTA
jgi:hypothetical protein